MRSLDARKLGAVAGSLLLGLGGGCSRPPTTSHPAASGTVTPGPAPGERPFAEHAAEPSASVPDPVEPPHPPAAELDFDWEREVIRSPKGGLRALAADREGVVLTGGESAPGGKFRPLAVRLDPRGKERWRALLDGHFATPPLRAFGAAVAIASTGEVYVVSATAEATGASAAHLTRLGPKGRHLWTAALPLWGQVPPALTLDAEGNATVIGIVAPIPNRAGARGGLGIVKLSPDGARHAFTQYPSTSGVPRVARGAGDHLLFALSLHGALEIGARSFRQDAKLSYACAGQERACEDLAHALLVGELDANGAPVRTRLFGTPANLVGVSDLAALPDGRILVTGEFFGPPMPVGALWLREREAGMPAAVPSVSFETGVPEACPCRTARRDLFVLELDRELEPRWRRTLGVGYPEPKVAVGPDGNVVWAAEVAEPTAPGDTADADPARASLWTIDARGNVLGRRIAQKGGARLMAAAPDGSLYLSDGRTLRKTRIAR